MEPILNSQLPEFSVQAFHNGAFKTVTNNDLKGKWAILFFYPADFTFVCPTELVDMAEKYDQFKAMGVEIYSVSTDSHFWVYISKKRVWLIAVHSLSIRKERLKWWN